MNNHIPEYFECNKCYKIFDKIERLQKHQKSKIVCDTLPKIVKNLEIVYKVYGDKSDELISKTYTSATNICFYCDTSYETKSKLRRHVTLDCNVKKNMDESYEKYNDLFCEYFNKLRRIKIQNRKLKKNTNDSLKTLIEEEVNNNPDGPKINLLTNKSLKKTSKGTVNNGTITNTINNTTERTIIVNLSGSIEDGIIFIDIKEL